MNILFGIDENGTDVYKFKPETGDLKQHITVAKKILERPDIHCVVIVATTIDRIPYLSSVTFDIKLVKVLYKSSPVSPSTTGSTALAESESSPTSEPEEPSGSASASCETADRVPADEQ